MKRITLSFAALLLSWSGASFAANGTGPITSGLHSIYGAVGFTEGGFALGADYEYMGFSTFGLGGYLRMYQKDEDRGTAGNGVVTFGAFVRPHFSKKEWDFYVSPGFGIISIDAVGRTPGDSTTAGPSLALGLLYELTSTVSLGVENMRSWVWFDEDYRGLVVNDMMFKFRLNF